MYTAICFGEILWDLLPTGKQPGGAPMNVAMHLHKQGFKSILISSIGNDQNGEDLKKFLKKEGLSSNYIQQHRELPTGIVNVTLDENKQASYSIVKPVAWDEIVYEKPLDDLAQADALIFGSLACRNAISRNTLLRLLKKSNLAVFDMNLRPPHFEKEILDDLIKRCDILKINEYELDYLKDHYALKEENIKNQLQQLSALTSTPTICVTLGDKGAVVWDDNRIYKHSGFKVTVTDTVGAGDAFLAAFISGYLQDAPMETTLATACATGAFVASKEGANPSYTLSQISALI